MWRLKKRKPQLWKAGSWNAYSCTGRKFALRIFSLGVVGLMTIFAIAGIVDIIFLRGKLGLGAEFKKGFELIGPLCLAMAGIMTFLAISRS